MTDDEKQKEYEAFMNSISEDTSGVGGLGRGYPAGPWGPPPGMMGGGMGFSSLPPMPLGPGGAPWAGVRGGPGSMLPFRPPHPLPSHMMRGGMMRGGMSGMSGGGMYGMPPPPMGVYLPPPPFPGGVAANGSASGGSGGAMSNGRGSPYGPPPAPPRLHPGLFQSRCGQRHCVSRCNVGKSGEEKRRGCEMVSSYMLE